MKKEQAEAFCQKWLPLWTGNQPEALAAVYSEDTYYRDPAMTQGVKGQEAFLVYLKKLLAANPSWRWYIEEVMETPKGFTLKWRAEIPVGSQVIQEYGLDIVELNEQGLVSRNEVYFDRTTLLKALRE